MKPTIQGVKGARDFYPEDMAFRFWLYQKLGKISKSYGYQEYDGPFLEKIELYAAKSGEELVKEQSFVFPDRSGELIALRPELTPSLARMVTAQQNELIFPIRWWSFGPFWRYERPQKGRSREFFQWNIDLIGVNSREADAEMLAIGCTLFKEIGLSPDQVVINVNSRELMESEILRLGIDNSQLASVFRLIDRKDKMSLENWKNYAIENGISEANFTGLRNLLQNTELWKQSPDLVRIFELVEEMGVSEYIHYDAGIIRGLDYYTGIVFEARDKEGGRAIFGGGRYNNLVADVGGQPAGGIGFAMGDVVLRLTLEKYDRSPELTVNPAQVLVTVFNEFTAGKSISIAVKLRGAGINTICYPEVSKLPKQFKFADRIGIKYILVIGPDEVQNMTVVVKDLVNSSQETLAESDLANYLLDKINQAHQG
jgi:histidyl-tRNA synthetase